MTTTVLPFKYAKQKRRITSFHKNKITSIAVPFIFIAVFLLLAALYIHGINNTVVYSITMEKSRKQQLILEEDIRILESELSSLAVGSNLERRAKDLGLQEGESATYIARDSMFAQNR